MKRDSRSSTNARVISYQLDPKTGEVVSTHRNLSRTDSHTVVSSHFRRSYGEKFPFASFVNMTVFAILFVGFLFAGSWARFNVGIDTYMPENSSGVRMPYKEWVLEDWSDFQELAESKGIGVYTLTRVLPTNLITNGDFSVDLNSDGLADGWFTDYVGVYSLLNGVQRVYSNGLSYRFRVGATGFNTVSGNQYYVKGTVNTNLVYFPTVVSRFLFVQGNIYSDGVFGTRSVFLTSTFTGANLFKIGVANPETTPNFTINDYADVSNVFIFNVSALKTAGLFGGMSDSAIKTVLDDYAQNGLTASNIGYFFDGPAAWDSLSIADKNTILSYYGLSFAGGDVVDLLDPWVGIYDLDLLAFHLSLGEDDSYIDFNYLSYYDYFALGNPVFASFVSTLGTIDSLFGKLNSANQGLLPTLFDGWGGASTRVG